MLVPTGSLINRRQTLGKKKPRPKLLFAYGTLNHPTTQKLVFGEEKKGESAILEGYQLCTYRSHLLFIQKAKGHQVEGTAYPLKKGDIKLTDLYEGQFYTRRKVVLKDGKEAYVYVATNRYRLVD